MAKYTWNALILEYLNALQASGYSNRTLKTYAGYLSQIRTLAPSPRVMTYKALLSWLSRDNLSLEARRQCRSIVYNFYQYLLKQGYIKKNPAQDLPKIKMAQPKARPARTF